MKAIITPAKLKEIELRYQELENKSDLLKSEIENFLNDVANICLEWLKDYNNNIDDIDSINKFSDVEKFKLQNYIIKTLELANTIGLDLSENANLQKFSEKYIPFKIHIIINNLQKNAKNSIIARSSKEVLSFILSSTKTRLIYQKNAEKNYLLKTIESFQIKFLEKNIEHINKIDITDPNDIGSNLFQIISSLLLQAKLNENIPLFRTCIFYANQIDHNNSLIDLYIIELVKIAIEEPFSNDNMCKIEIKKIFEKYVTTYFDESNENKNAITHLTENKKICLINALAIIGKIKIERKIEIDKKKGWMDGHLEFTKIYKLITWNNVENIKKYREYLTPFLHLYFSNYCQHLFLKTDYIEYLNFIVKVNYVFSHLIINKVNSEIKTITTTLGLKILEGLRLNTKPIDKVKDGIKFLCSFIINENGMSIFNPKYFIEEIENFGLLLIHSILQLWEEDKSECLTLLIIITELSCVHNNSFLKAIKLEDLLKKLFDFFENKETLKKYEHEYLQYQILSGIYHCQIAEHKLSERNLTRILTAFSKSVDSVDKIITLPGFTYYFYLHEKTKNPNEYAKNKTEYTDYFCLYASELLFNYGYFPEFEIYFSLYLFKNKVKKESIEYLNAYRFIIIFTSKIIIKDPPFENIRNLLDFMSEYLKDVISSYSNVLLGDPNKIKNYMSGIAISDLFFIDNNLILYKEKILEFLQMLQPLLMKNDFKLHVHLYPSIAKIIHKNLLPLNQNSSIFVLFFLKISYKDLLNQRSLDELYCMINYLIDSYQKQLLLGNGEDIGLIKMIIFQMKDINYLKISLNESQIQQTISKLNPLIERLELITFNNNSPASEKLEDDKPETNVSSEGVGEKNLKKRKKKKPHKKSKATISEDNTNLDLQQNENTRISMDKQNQLLDESTLDQAEQQFNNQNESQPQIQEVSEPEKITITTHDQEPQNQASIPHQPKIQGIFSKPDVDVMPTQEQLTPSSKTKLPKGQVFTRNTKPTNSKKNKSIKQQSFFNWIPAAQETLKDSKSEDEFEGEDLSSEFKSLKTEPKNKPKKIKTPTKIQPQIKPEEVKTNPGADVKKTTMLSDETLTKNVKVSTLDDTAITQSLETPPVTPISIVNKNETTHEIKNTIFALLNINLSKPEQESVISPRVNNQENDNLQEVQKPSEIKEEPSIVTMDAMHSQSNDDLLDPDPNLFYEQLPEEAKNIFFTLADLGANISALEGGAVVCWLRGGKKPEDYDIVTNAPLHIVAEHFSKLRLGCYSLILVSMGNALVAERSVLIDISKNYNNCLILIKYLDRMEIAGYVDKDFVTHKITLSELDIFSQKIPKTNDFFSLQSIMVTQEMHTIIINKGFTNPNCKVIGTHPIVRVIENNHQFDISPICRDKDTNLEQGFTQIKLSNGKTSTYYPGITLDQDAMTGDLGCNKIYFCFERKVPLDNEFVIKFYDPLKALHRFNITKDLFMPGPEVRMSMNPEIILRILYLATKYDSDHIEINTETAIRKYVHNILNINASYLLQLILKFFQYRPDFFEKSYNILTDFNIFNISFPLLFKDNAENFKKTLEIYTKLSQNYPKDFDDIPLFLSLLMFINIKKAERINVKDILSQLDILLKNQSQIIFLRPELISQVKLIIILYLSQFYKNDNFNLFHIQKYIKSSNIDISNVRRMAMYFNIIFSTKNINLEDLHNLHIRFCELLNTASQKLKNIQTYHNDRVFQNISTNEYLEFPHGFNNFEQNQQFYHSYPYQQYVYSQNTYYWWQDYYLYQQPTIPNQNYNFYQSRHAYLSQYYYNSPSSFYYHPPYQGENIDDQNSESQCQQSSYGTSLTFKESNEN